MRNDELIYRIKDSIDIEELAEKLFEKNYNSLNVLLKDIHDHVWDPSAIWDKYYLIYKKYS